jgi:hypothetical protein
MSVCSCVLPRGTLFLCLHCLVGDNAGLLCRYAYMHILYNNEVTKSRYRIQWQFIAERSCPFTQPDSS